eukprot:4838242-Pleurochrysis_carterae.AAC.1
MFHTHRRRSADPRAQEWKSASAGVCAQLNAPQPTSTHLHPPPRGSAQHLYMHLPCRAPTYSPLPFHTTMSPPSDFRQLYDIS